MCQFSRYLGVDYSGAATPTRSLPGLRVYRAGPEQDPAEVLPVSGARKYFTRRGLAEWLVEELREGPPALVGIDHGFSFPVRYFEAHGIPHDWSSFLEDFNGYWPTDGDDTSVESVRRGVSGRGAQRAGNSRWRRRAEERCRAKSVFHFDVQGSVAKSTHAGLPWLLYLRRQLGGRVHFWPFDGWTARPGISVVAEMYPALWSGLFPREDRNGHQHDAYSVARWMQEQDAAGGLGAHFDPALSPEERAVARVEGWIFGLL
jgi:hypothetical protein